MRKIREERAAGKLSGVVNASDLWGWGQDAKKAGDLAKAYRAAVRAAGFKLEGCSFPLVKKLLGCAVYGEDCSSPDGLKRLFDMVEETRIPEDDGY